MNFLMEKVVPHLQKGDTASNPVTDSGADSKKGDTSFYLKLLCNKSSEWTEVQVVGLDAESGEFLPRL